MYIPDPLNHRLCEWCLDRDEPPQGFARTRTYELLQEILPQRVAWEIAEFTHDEFEPWVAHVVG